MEDDNIAVGVPVIETSGLIGDGLDQIELYLQERKTVAFIGSSGVGKSTLINRLPGEVSLKTNTLAVLFLFLRNCTIQDAWFSKEFDDFRSHLRNSCPKCENRSNCMITLSKI